MTDIAVYVLDSDYKRTVRLPIRQGQFDIDLYGGCGLGSFRMDWAFDAWQTLVSYQHRPVLVDILDNPIWQGFIVKIKPVMSERNEYLQVDCQGWVHIFSILRQWKYRKGETVPDSGITITRWSDIVKDLAWRIANDSRWNITVGRIDDSDEMPDLDPDIAPAEFTMRMQSYMEGFRLLGRLAGNWQWGIDRNRQIYFYPAPDNVHFEVVVGRDIEQFRPTSDASKIINRILVRGGTGTNPAGEQYRFFYVGDDLLSQAQWGVHFASYSQPEVNDAQTAQIFCQNVFEQYAQPRERVRLTLRANIATYEPYLGKMLVFNPPDQRFVYPITRTRYMITDQGLIARPELGVYPPDLATELARLKLEQEKMRKEGLGEEWFKYGDDWDISYDANLTESVSFVSYEAF